VCVCMISEAERLVIDFVERHDPVMTRVPSGKRMRVRCVGGKGCVEVVERQRGRRGEGESEICEGEKLDTLFRTQMGVTASAGQRRRDVEMRNYLRDQVGRRNLVFNLAVKRNVLIGNVLLPIALDLALRCSTQRRVDVRRMRGSNPSGFTCVCTWVWAMIVYCMCVSM
jgi:hypothetical protein